MDEAYFTERLLPGERILWTGRPAGGVLFTSRDIFLIPFSLVWLGLVLSTFVRAPNSGSQPDFLVFELLFVLAGLFAVFGRFALDAWIRDGTRYALTDRRVLISRSSPFKAFISVGLGQLPDVQLTEGGGGRGTIRFGPGRSLWGRQGLGLWMPAVDGTPQFLAIGDVRQVFDRIQQAAAKAAGSRA